MMSQSVADCSGGVWNFFSRADEPDIWCAVPVEQAVPRFLLSGAWTFGGHRMQPPGFQPSAAREGNMLNGFYLFHRVS